jgi:hypothetical protein
MKFPRRRFLHLAAGAAALPAASRFARAQTYPIRPVRIVVGFFVLSSGVIVNQFAPFPPRATPPSSVKSGSE